MEPVSQADGRKTLRNLIIFVVVTLSCGWIGIWLDSTIDSPSAQDKPGMLIWLVAPLLTAILLRTLAGDGWRDAGLRPYLFKFPGTYLGTILLHPAAIALITLAGILAGAISLPPVSSSSLGNAILAVLGVNLFKNIFEEYAWRGYLAPRMYSLNINRMLAHLLVGLVWGIWHIPYYIGLLDITELQGYTPLSLAVFLPLVILSCMALSILYGEILLKTGSVFPALLMHTIANSLILPLVSQGILNIEPGLHFIFTPGVEGLLSIFIYALAGLALYKARLRK